MQDSEAVSLTRHVVAAETRSVFLSVSREIKGVYFDLSLSLFHVCLYLSDFLGAQKT